MKIVACNSNRPLAECVAKALKLPLAKATIRRFADMEIFVEIHENVRGEDVFILQSTSAPANDNIMELLITLDALRRASARRITAVIPYFGYARQDRKSGSRTPISAKLVANLITEAGANRVLTMDLHAGQIQGFFDIPVDNLYAAPLFSRDIQGRFAGQDVMIVSPDVGGVARAREVASRLDVDLAIIDKRRERAGVSEVMNVIGDVRNKACILIDDIVDSGGTLCNAAAALMDRGARSASVYVTHGVLSGEAAARIGGSCIESLTMTDSIQATDQARAAPNIRQFTIAPILAEAMQRISDESSVRLAVRLKRIASMKFFYAPGACSLGIHTVLEEIGQPFEAVRVSLRGTPEERAALDAVNPKGKVPTIQRDDGMVITEYPVIAHYLAEANPAANLLPQDKDAALEAAEAMDYCVATIHMQGFSRLFRPSNFTPSEADHEAVKARGKELVDKGFDVIAKQLGSKDWIGGTYSVADSALFYVEYWGAKRMKMAIPAPLAAHLDRMLARPAVQRMMATEGLAA